MIEIISEIVHKSKCCEADVVVASGVQDFEEDVLSEATSKMKNLGQTLHYECSKCGRPCDII